MRNLDEAIENAHDRWEQRRRDDWNEALDRLRTSVSDLRKGGPDSTFAAMDLDHIASDVKDLRELLAREFDYEPAVEP